MCFTFYIYILFFKPFFFYITVICGQAIIKYNVYKVFDMSCNLLTGMWIQGREKSRMVPVWMQSGECHLLLKQHHRFTLF